MATQEKTRTVGPCEQIEKLWERLRKARNIVKTDGVANHPAEVGTYVVVSQTNAAITYRVKVEAGTCECEDWSSNQHIHRGWCKHRLAVQLYRFGNGGAA